MKRSCLFDPRVLILISLCLLAGMVRAERNDPRVFAGRILDMSGVQGGIIVHLGSGDARLTAALYADDSHTVHGLETDPAKVAESLKRFGEKNLKREE